MRGSLNKPRKKAAQQNLEKTHTKKSREGLALFEGQTLADDGVQQSDANIDGIFLSDVPRDTFDKAKRSKLKPIRGSLDVEQSHANLKVGVQEGITNMDDVIVPNMHSLDRTNSNSTKGNFERLKLKPLRGSRKTGETKEKVVENGEKGNTNMDAMSLPNVLRDTFDKAKRSKLKPIRGSLDAEKSHANLKVGVQEGNTNMDDVIVPNMHSLDKTESNSTKGKFERLTLRPSRGSRKTGETKEKVIENGEEGNTNMDAMSLPNMLRFLEMEEILLTQLQSKMSSELSRLQVEEHVFLQTLKILGQKHASTDKEHDQHETSSGDQDFIDALNEALMENGESVPSNEDKGEGISEE